MAWSDEARQASIEARRANKQSNNVAHQNGVGKVGQPSGLSDRVLDVVRSNPNGFSVTPTGEQPSKGYMVSLPGHSKVLSDNELHGPGAKDILNSYASEHAEALRTPGAHIGGWRDSASGKTYLDISHNIPRQREAVKAGKARNQIAVWDVKRSREIRTGGTGE